jgi:hypothetical protein
MRSSFTVQSIFPINKGRHISGNGMRLSELFEKSQLRKKTRRKKEEEEISAVAKTGPLTKQGSYMGGATGMSGKDHANPSYLGKSIGKAYDSTGMLGAG